MTTTRKRRRVVVARSSYLECTKAGECGGALCWPISVSVSLSEVAMSVMCVPVGGWVAL